MNPQLVSYSLTSKSAISFRITAFSLLGIGCNSKSYPGSTWRIVTLQGNFYSFPVYTKGSHHWPYSGLNTFNKQIQTLSQGLNQLANKFPISLFSLHHQSKKSLYRHSNIFFKYVNIIKSISQNGVLKMRDTFLPKAV